uniref:Uncharacterized protein n=1 Tax=Magnetococcus massalia (strain MO-1) TaxID=451514 RepID=A0A1S7LHT0_MAGMO|nr:protein of unknown function [Candidatus Magnetococcus massalia]
MDICSVEQRTILELKVALLKFMKLCKKDAEVKEKLYGLFDRLPQLADHHLVATKNNHECIGESCKLYSRMKATVEVVRTAKSYRELMERFKELGVYRHGGLYLH